MPWYLRFLQSMGLYTPPPLPKPELVPSPKPQPVSPVIPSDSGNANTGQGKPAPVTNSASIPNTVIQIGMKMSEAGLALTKYCEGLYLSSYQDSRGIWTIGYGRIEYDDGRHVGPGESCTIEDAEKWLLEDLENDGSHYVRAWVKTPLTQNQFDALSDFTFNRGAGRLKTLLAMPGNIADNFLTAVPGDKELGLQRRRRMNRAMYLGLPWEEFKEWKPS